MTDPIVGGGSPAPDPVGAAPAPVPAPAPAAIIEPVATQAPTVAVTEPPATAAPAVSEPPATSAAPDATKTLLEQADDKAKEPDATAAPDETIYAPFELPEGISIPPEQLQEYHTLLAEHGISQAAGQALISKHVAALQEVQAQYAKQAADHQMSVWDDTNKGWVTQVMADPELGGAGHKTAMARVARMRDLFVSERPGDAALTEQRRNEFNEFLRATGAGNHPVFLRFLNNVARRFDEPAPANPGNVKPAPDAGRRPGTGRLRDLYSETQK